MFGGKGLFFHAKRIPASQRGLRLVAQFRGQLFRGGLLFRKLGRQRLFLGTQCIAPSRSRFRFVAQRRRLFVRLGFEFRVLRGQCLLFRAKHIPTGGGGFRFVAEGGCLFFGFGLQPCELGFEFRPLCKRGLALFGKLCRTLARFPKCSVGVGRGSLGFLECGDFGVELRELGACLAACGRGGLQLARGFLLGVDEAGFQALDLFAHFRGGSGRFRGCKRGQLLNFTNRALVFGSDRLALRAEGSEVGCEFLVRNLEFGEGAGGTACGGELRLVFDEGVPFRDQRLDPCAVALDVGLETAHGAGFPPGFDDWRGGSFLCGIFECGNFTSELIPLGGSLPLCLVESFEFLTQLLLQPRELGVPFPGDGFGLPAHFAADGLHECRGFAARTIGSRGGALRLDL